jgi:methionine-rich copper-binding protein CopC
VKADAGKSIILNGSLSAVGTSSSPITFTGSTAVAHSSACGNCTDTTSSNYWAGISGNGVITCAYCTIEYAGTSGTALSGSGTITNSTIRYSQSLDFQGTFTNNLVSEAHTTPVIWNGGTFSGNTIENTRTHDSTEHLGGQAGFTTIGIMHVKAFQNENWSTAAQAYAQNNSFSITNNTFRGTESGHAGILLDNCCGGSSTVLTIEDNIFTNNATREEALIAGTTSIGGSLVIKDNLFLRNYGKILQVKHYSPQGLLDEFEAANIPFVEGTVTITNNKFIDSLRDPDPSSVGGQWMAAPAVTVSGTTTTVTGNIFHNSSLANGSSNYATITDNTFTVDTLHGLTNESHTPATGIANFGSGNGSLSQNNFFNDGIHLYNPGSSAITAENNWWGSTTPSTIDASIHDWNDDVTLGVVDYTPYLSAPSTTAPPSPPQNVAAQTGPTSISLSWTANPESDITGYKVYYDTDASTTSFSFDPNSNNWYEYYSASSAYPFANVIDAGNVTSYTITNLSTGTAYSVAIAAYDSDGNESWISNELMGDFRTAPSEVTGLDGTAGNTAAILSWATPATTGGAAITDYIIEQSTDNGITWVLSFYDGEDDDTSVALTSLTNGTTYTYRVSAVNIIGTGPASSSFSLTPVTIPGQPTGLEAIADNQVADLTWNAPSSDGGSPITDYRIEYSSDSGTTWVLFGDETGTATSLLVTGLTNQLQYSFRISAVTAAGVGPSSSEVSATSAPTIPDPPTGLTGTSGDGEVALTWTAPLNTGGPALIDYTITYSSDGGTSWTTASDGTSTTAAATITGLSNGVLYQFRVAAVNSFGTGTTSTATSTRPEVDSSYARSWGSNTTPTSLAKGEYRSASVTVTNIGNTTWSASATSFGYRIYDDTSNLVATSTLTQLDADVPGGETATITARIDAPLSAGTYSVRWDLYSTTGATWFADAQGSAAVISLTVTADAYYGLSWGEQVVPSSINAKGPRHASVTVTNTGTQTWGPSTHFLGYHVYDDNGNFLYTGDWSVFPASLASGETVTLNRIITAPATPGDYTIAWDIIDTDNPTWFSAMSNAALPSALTVTQPVHGITWGSHTTPTSLSQDERTSISLTLTNSGTKTWLQGAFFLSYHVFDANGNYLYTGPWSSLNAQRPQHAETITLTVPFHAPSDAGTYTIKWDMVDMHVPTWFSARNVATLDTSLTITSGAAYGLTAGQSTLPAHTAAQSVSVSVPLTNTGAITWDTNRFFFSYHWYDENGSYISTGQWVLLPEAVAPGASTTATITVETPETPGNYQLLWDIIDYQGSLWFSELEPLSPQFESIETVVSLS